MSIYLFYYLPALFVMDFEGIANFDFGESVWKLIFPLLLAIISYVVRMGMKMFTKF